MLQKVTNIKKNIFYLLAVLLLLNLYNNAAAQTLTGIIKTYKNSSDPPEESISLYNDLSEFHRVLDQNIHQLRLKGYLEASVDSLSQTSDTVLGVIYQGQQFHWERISIDSVPPFLNGKIALKEDFYERETDLLAFDQKIRDIVFSAAESGYPLVKIKVDTLIIAYGKTTAYLSIVPGPLIFIEKISVIDDAIKIRNRYLEMLTGINSGSIYNQNTINNIANKVEQVPFIEMDGDPQIELLGDYANIQIPLKDRKVNQFDILIGLIPSPDPQRRFQLNGNINIDLYNQFSSGERLSVDYLSLSQQTQRLNLAFSYPFIFNRPFGIDLSADFFRKDSSFINLNYRTGLQYLFSINNRLGFYIEKRSSSLLNFNEIRVIQQKSLPSILDSRQSLYGVSWHFNQLDYLYNPRKGWQIEADVSLGSKRILLNDKILDLSDPENPEFDFNTLYDTVDLRASLGNFQFNLFKYFPLGRQATILVSFRFGWQNSGNGINENEVFRIGGSQLLRGFNEESIFSPLFLVSTLEYRILFNRNSNLFVFLDYGQIKEFFQKDKINALGTGVGMNLQTKIGIFSISYALGKTNGDPLSFRDARIHFGMTSLF